MDKIFFSIIIPVYKVETYLEKCVDSILTQLYTNFELILVDDGSPDRCSALCDAYKQKDNRIKVIHQNNQGASVARNCGINIAKGDYILFVDGDDYLDSNTVLGEIKKCIEHYNSDLILLPFKKNDLRTGKCKILNSNYDVNLLVSSNMEKVIAYLFKHNLFPAAPWTVCVNLNLLKEEKIYFKAGIKAEDFEWLIHLFLKIKTVSAIGIPFNVYNINREGSVTYTSDKRSIESLLCIIDTWYQELLSRKQWYLLNHLSFVYITIFATYAYLPKLVRKDLYPEIRKRSYILNYACTKRNKCLVLLLKILGPKFFSLGIKVYRNIF